MKRKTATSATYGSVRELARELNIGISNTYKALNKGTIPGIRIGNRYVLPKAAIAEWLKSGGKRQVS
jgi:excisionase family DNA binding protein